MRRRSRAEGERAGDRQRVRRPARPAQRGPDAAGRARALRRRRDRAAPGARRVRAVPIASGRITHIDTAAALASPEVVAVFTAEDLAPYCAGWRGLLAWPGMVAGLQTPLAAGVVRHVGEPVVLVAATSRAAAEDAAELVVVDYEELPPVLDPLAALDDGSPLVHEELGTNLCFGAPFGTGDVDAAFAEADRVVEVTVQTGRHTAVALEMRGVLASFDRQERTLTVRVSTQAPQMLQTLYARELGLPENSVRVLTEHVGGAFGMKAFVYPDEMAVVTAAMLVDRPLKWTQDRYEALQSDTQARDERVTASLALAADGRILGLRSDVVSDAGAWSMYPRGCVTEGVQVATIMPGPYRVPAYAADLRVVYTNKAPLAVYRAVGHPPAILVMELLMDEAARALGLPADEIRRRNLLRPEDLPYTSPTGNVYDSGSHLESLEQAVAGMGSTARSRGRRRGRRPPAAGCLLGVGFASFVELSAPGAMFYGAKGAPITAHDQVEVTVQPDGSVTVVLGTPGQGQGLHTTAAQVVADGLGVRLEDVRVLSGDTAVAPHGSGVWASRSAVVSAGAASAAAVEVRRRLLLLASHLLEADPADLEMSEGLVGVRGVPSTRLPRAGGRPGRVLGHAPAPARDGGRAGGGRLLLRAAVHVQQRHPRGGRRGRAGHRAGPGRRLLRRRGLRRPDQPRHRRRPDPRGSDPGTGRGAARARDPRRDRPAADVDDARLPRPDGGRRARHPDRAHRDPRADDVAGHEGRGGGRHGRGAGGHPLRGERRARPRGSGGGLAAADPPGGRARRPGGRRRTVRPQDDGGTAAGRPWPAAPGSSGTPARGRGRCRRGARCARPACGPPPAPCRRSAGAACVSWNTSHAAIGMSSNPRIETSRGTRTPRDSAASSAPNATTSLPQTIAVGGSGRRSSSRVCW